MDMDAVTQAVKLLCEGRLVAVPTETVYGLAADATSSSAVAEIYRVKGRPDFNPLITHIPDSHNAERLARFSDTAWRIADRFWPGPLTLVLPRRADCPVTPAVTAGLDTIALRCPAQPLMQAVLRESGLALAAPSANRSGAISPTTADHVRAGLGNRIPFILDGGPCPLGLESTIVAFDDDGWRLLRPGPITEAELAAELGAPKSAQAPGRVTAPGQLASHYAPSKPLALDVAKAQPDQFHIGFGRIAGDCNLSPSADLAEAAANLFAALHRADASDRPGIAVAPIPPSGIGAAIADRLGRAALGTRTASHAFVRQGKD